MQVSLQSLIVWPLVFNLVLLMSCWIYYVYIQRDSASKFAATRSRIYRCERCDRVYLDTRDVPMAKCPQCGCLNEAVKT